MAIGGGEGWGVMCGDTVPLCGESTIGLVKPTGPAAVPAKPGNELKKFGEAIKKECKKTFVNTVYLLLMWGTNLY